MQRFPSAEPWLRMGRTSDFAPRDLDQARQLLQLVFDDISDADWEHGLGGTHVMAWCDDAVVGHASLTQRRLLHRGAALRVGYVEAVAVHPEHRRRGLGGRLMAVLERAICAAYDLGALGASDIGVPFYRQRGWLPWRGELSALSPKGVVPTPEERGCVHVFLTAREVDLDAELICEWRDGDAW